MNFHPFSHDPSVGNEVKNNMIIVWVTSPFIWNIYIYLIKSFGIKGVLYSLLFDHFTLYNVVSRIQRLTTYLSLKHLLFSFWTSFLVAKKEKKKTEEFIMRGWGQKVYFSGITCKDIVAMILFPLIRTHLSILLLAMPFVRSLASICSLWWGETLFS